MEPPVFASNSILGHIGGPLRTLPDDMENDAFEGDEVIDAEDVADMIEEKVAESSSSNIEFRRSAVIDFDFESVWDCSPNLTLCRSDPECNAGIYIYIETR